MSNQPLQKLRPSIIEGYGFRNAGDSRRPKKKNNIDGNRIRTDLALERTRKGWVESKKAATAGKLLRRAFNSLLVCISNGKLAALVLREMMKVIKSDPNNELGSRNILDRELEMLKGFDFNPDVMFCTSFLGSYEPVIDRRSGKTSFTILSFITKESIIEPTGIEIDFEKENYARRINKSEYHKFGPGRKNIIVRSIKDDSHYNRVINALMSMVRVHNNAQLPLNPATDKMTEVPLEPEDPSKKSILRMKKFYAYFFAVLLLTQSGCVGRKFFHDKILIYSQNDGERIDTNSSYIDYYKDTINFIQYPYEFYNGKQMSGGKETISGSESLSPNTYNFSNVPFMF